jgi:hypothetical protein
LPTLTAGYGSMEESIVLWAKACLSIVGLVGRGGDRGRSDIYLWVSHVSSVRKSWCKGSNVGVSQELF